MNVTPSSFRALLAELVDENDLACRGVLGLCDVVFTESIPTACVTLGARSVLRVNLAFVNRHCETPEHVRALILHEFLHVLLGHTRQIGTVTQTKNFAADCVINAIIHRALGATYSSFFSNYYLGEKYDPFLCLLCPREASFKAPGYDHRKEKHADIHVHLNSGATTMEDVLDYARELRAEELREALRKGRKILLGGHGDWEPGELPPDLEAALQRARNQLEGEEGPLGEGVKRTDLGVPISTSQLIRPWSQMVAALLRRLVVPDQTSKARATATRLCSIPILNPGDRRSALRSLWSPILPEAAWKIEHKGQRNGTAVYLDVSGSMNNDLALLTPLLSRHSQWLRRPFWAFSNEVRPARFESGRLLTQTTGGTSLEAVVKHLEETRPLRALVITDGYVEMPHPAWAATFSRHGVEFLISAYGTDRRLASLKRPIHCLPPLPEKTS